MSVNYEWLNGLLHQVGLSVDTVAILGVGLGAMLLVFGLSGAIAGEDPSMRRMSQQSRSHRRSLDDNGILRHGDMTPTGFMRTFIPNDRRERTLIQRQLAQAGLNGRNALRNFYLTRMVLGVLLPCAFLATVTASRSGLVELPVRVETAFANLTQFNLLQILTVLVAAGFFGPALWLRSRSSERRQLIEESFPNALDLIQISVASGLGFDAAMIRVANELATTAPAISEEFLIAQREIQAGRSRDLALLEMAARTGVEEVNSFANVVVQSIQFGTDISDAMTSYAKEMRVNRELRAQEKANKLPVQMSAVMASLMLPALILVTLGPVVIRYIRYFAG